MRRFSVGQLAMIAVMVVLGAAALARAQQPPPPQDCAWTSRALGSAPYVVMIGDSVVSGHQRLDTALRRAVAEEAADPRRDVQIRAGFRIECPIPVAVQPDSVVITNEAGERGPYDLPVGDEMQLCALVYYPDRVLNSCDPDDGLTMTLEPVRRRQT